MRRLVTTIELFCFLVFQFYVGLAISVHKSKNLRWVAFHTSSVLSCVLRSLLAVMEV